MTTKRILVSVGDGRKYITPFSSSEKIPEYVDGQTGEACFWLNAF